MAERKALLHVGTHKTGTKSIQLFLNHNWKALREAGLYVPQRGRRMMGEAVATPGHHDLVIALLQNDDTLVDAMFEEIRNERAPSVLVSSEEFHPMIDRRKELATLRERFTDNGYETTAIVYLRPQPDYAQSVYAEIAKTANSWNFANYVETIVRDGALNADSGWPTVFEYSHIVLGLADIFGAKNVVVRPYDAAKEPQALIADFMRVVTAIRGPIVVNSLVIRSPHLNRRSSFAQTLADMHQHAFKLNPHAISTYDLATRAGFDAADVRLAEPFSVMSFEEHARLTERFALDNAQVEAMSGITFPIKHVAPSDESWKTAAFQRALLDLALEVWFK